MAHILPAIDLKGGKVVRLLQGDYRRETVYETDALAVAQRWVSAGAQFLHVVDLDGARAGTFQNLSLVASIVQDLPVSVHFGGGVRAIADIKRVLGLGVQRVIIGTKFFQDGEFRQEVARLAKSVRQRLIVSIDCRRAEDGAYYVQHTGWTADAACTASDALRLVTQAGIELAVITDIMKDGTLRGPNTDLWDQMVKDCGSIRLIASGGIAGLNDLESLCSRGKDVLFGIIIGKALYEGTIDLKEAIATCR